MDISTNEIWLCKKSFFGVNDIVIKCEEPYSVVIVMKPDSFNGEEFVRVQPVSKQIKFRSDEDILVEDETLLGYPFIIETWNEQPILTKLLDKKIGSIKNISGETEEQNEYTEEQLSFRKSEIRRTAFLRQSVLSYIDSSEIRNHNIKITKILSYAATIIGVIFILWQPHKHSSDQFIAKYQDIKPLELVSISQNNLLRGEEVSIEGFSKDVSIILQLAVKKYKESDFDGASILFKKTPDLLYKNSEITFFAALSDLYNGNTLSSINKFEYLRRISPYKNGDDVLYYLALAYVKEGKAREARKVLKELNLLYPDYLNDKPNIFKDLRWF
jgi:tetratricopeptide (TPR) repeat protein